MQLDGPHARRDGHGEAWAADLDPLGRSLRRATRPDTNVGALSESFAYRHWPSSINAEADPDRGPDPGCFSGRPSLRPDRLRELRRLRRRFHLRHEWR